MSGFKFIYGVFINQKGNLALVLRPKDKKMDFIADKGKERNHPFFRHIKQSIYEEGQGEYFYNRSLRGFSLLQELCGSDADEI